MCDSGSSALLVYCISSGRGARCTMSSWRRSCCPSGASCCGGLEVKRCGRDQQGDDMADQMTEPFYNDDAQSCVVKLLNHKHICDMFLRQECFVHARYGCVFCAHPSSNCQHYIPAIRNSMSKKITHCPSSDFEECHNPSLPCRILSQYGRRRRCVRQISLLLFAPLPYCFPINNELIIFTTFELLIRILTHLFARRNWFIELLCFRHVIVLFFWERDGKS